MGRINNGRNDAVSPGYFNSPYGGANQERKMNDLLKNND